MQKNVYICGIANNKKTNYMRKLLILLLGLLASVYSMAQDMKVVDFRLLENDLTANTRGTEKMDQNGERAALIKIVTPETLGGFGGCW